MFNFLISNKGQLIAHPDFMKQITEVEGDLKILNLKDDVLSNVWKQISFQNKDNGQFETPGLDGYLVGYDKIEGPDWYYISVYPKAIVWQSAFNNAQVVLYPIVVFNNLIKYKTIRAIKDGFGCFFTKGKAWQI